VLLEEEVRWLKAQYYGRSTQSSDAAEQNPDQKMLFNEAEVLAAIEAADEAHRQRTTKIDAHERKRSADSGRKAIPDHFPRIEIEHDLAPEQKMCTKCAVPHPLTRIGQEIRECYRFEPPKISVEQHIRPTYVCEELHEAPITAPAPPVILPKSMASPSLLAHVIKSKFDLGLPIYRVSQDLKRYRMNLGPGTLGTWVNTVGGEKVVPLINLLGEELLAAAFMHIDETPLQVLRSDKAVGSDHYIVVRAGGPPGQRIILYDYIASRTTAALKQLFVGPDGAYQGKFISDGLERYDDIADGAEAAAFWLLTALPHDVLQGAQGQPTALQPHAGERGDGGLHPSGLSDRGTDQGAAGRVCSSAGKPCPWRRCAGAAPAEVQAHPGEVQSLGR
jgi:transposase